MRERCTIGSPERCVDELRAICERLGPTHLILKMNYAGVPPEVVEHSIRLAAERVFPAL